MKTNAPLANTPETLPSSPFFARLSSGLHAIGEGIAELLWPTRCILCDVPGTLLCDGCRLEIFYIDPVRACPYCGQAHGRYACIDCNSFMTKHRRGEQYVEGESQGHECGHDVFLDRIASVFEFIDPCRKLITTYKDRKEIRLAEVLAGLLDEYIDPSWIIPNDTALVVVPARKQAIRERGFDHMRQIGKRLSLISGLPLLDLIAPQERGDQRGLSSVRRQRNMKDSFRPKLPKNYEKSKRDMPHERGESQRAKWSHGCDTGVCSVRLPSTVILVDDVYTTGATLNAAAAVLKEMGIKHVFGLTLGRIP